MAATNVFVDDTDPRISYTGPWFTAPGPTEDIGFYGGVWNNTLHATHANASLSLTFSGIWIILYTTSTTPAGLTGPRYQCFVDGVPQTIVGIADSTGPTNHWSTCGNDALADGPHTFTVNVTLSASGNQTAWVDFVKYAPSASVDLSGETVLVQNFSPDLTLGKGWGPLPVSEANVNPWSSSTNVTGSALRYEFIGRSLIWYALATTYVPNVPAPCTYAVDASSPIPFTTVGLGSRNPTQNEFFVILFETGPLSLGKHTLDVVYQGGINDTPLILDYLVVQNGTRTLAGGVSGGGGTMTTTTPGPGSGSTITAGGQGQTQAPGSNTNTNAQEHQAKTNIGAIIGGVLGALVLLLCIALLILCLRRRRHRNLKDAVEAQPHAFTALPQSPSSPGFGNAMGMGAGYGSSANDLQAPVSAFVADSNGMASRATLEAKRPLLAPNRPSGLSASSSASAGGSSQSPLPSFGGGNGNGGGIGNVNVNEKSVPMRESLQEVPPPMYTPE